MSEVNAETAEFKKGPVKPLYRWRITRIIQETYDGYGHNAKEAIDWLNSNSGGASTVTVKSEKAEKVNEA